MENYGPATFGEHMAEVYDAWYGTRETDRETEAAVEVLSDLAGGGGRVLELGVGTGRLAIPLSARGLSVTGIDASEAMVAKLKEKAGGERVTTVIGDMAEVDVEGEFELIFVAFNTLLNLTTQDAQVRCFENVAGRLAEGGVFVVETYVPGDDPGGVRAVDVTAETATVEVAVHDRVTQVVEYQYVVLGPAGVRLFPVPQRYVWPSEMDLMARVAGLNLLHRWSGWDRRAFSGESRTQVVVYGRG